MNTGSDELPTNSYSLSTSSTAMSASVFQSTAKTTVRQQLSFLNPLNLGRAAMSTLFDSPAQTEASSRSAATKKHYKPSQFVVDEEGSKWRLCAGAAVFNSRNEILVGERLGKPGSWQAPQGGVDANSHFDSSRNLETVTEAAIRELYEEVGLLDGTHVLLEPIGDEDDVNTKCRYTTAGTGSWLEKEGFAGQELHWVVFRVADAMLDQNPSLLCRLNGMNGESAEFSTVRWESLDWVVENIWENKARPYQVLRELSLPIQKKWEDRCRSIDFSGRWSRDSNRSIGLVEGLVSRGMTEERAIKKAHEPYIQNWNRSQCDLREWIVTTYDANGIMPRRELHYPIGQFEEAYEGTSTLFGGNDGGVVSRRCCYLAEKDADDQIAHVTLSETPRGEELAARYLKNGELILKRTFWHSWGSHKVESIEVFTRC